MKNLPEVKSIFYKEIEIKALGLKYFTSVVVGNKVVLFAVYEDFTCKEIASFNTNIKSVHVLNRLSLKSGVPIYFELKTEEFKKRDLL